MHLGAYPVGAKWHIMIPGVGSENIVFLVAKENPIIGILHKQIMLFHPLYV